MMSRVRIAMVVLTAVVLGAAGIGHALDCNGRVVSIGASPWDVQGICGDPEQVNDTIEIILKPVYGPHGRAKGTCRWECQSRCGLITSGRHGSCIFCTFLEGALVKIDTGGYGH